MSLEFEVLLPEEFLIKHIETGIRPDGRKLTDRRPISISSGNIKSADGSAIVKQGNTTVACGIKAELSKPTAEKPDQGFIVPNLILPPMCHPSVKAGPPSSTAQELSVFIKDVILSSECLQLTQLCPVLGKVAWVLYIDVLCLDHDGNLRDASIAAVMAALNSLKLPEVEYDADMDQIVVSKDAKSMNILCNPVCCSFSVFNLEPLPGSVPDNSAQFCLVADPTYSEQEVANSEISFVILEKGEICFTNQTGSMPLTQDNLQKAVSLATDQALQIRKALNSLRSKCGIDMESWEQMINLHQAVTMLRNESGNQERWLDWALSQILDKSTNISAINLPLRKQLFAILSSVFIKEIQNISENNPSDDCSGYLLAYLTKGRGYALVLCMAKIPEKGTCPLELTILLLYLVSRVKQKVKDDKLDLSLFNPMTLTTKEELSFGVTYPPHTYLKSHHVRALAGQPRTSSTRSARRHETGPPPAPFPEDRGPTAGGTVQREFENLAEYEDMSDSDLEIEEEGVITDGLHVNHINYLQYYDNSDLDSESVVVTSRVAPPPIFSSLQHQQPFNTTTKQQPSQPPPKQGQNKASSPSEEDEIVTAKYASLLSELLNLCRVCTGGLWNPLIQKDNQIVHKIISVVAELIKVDIGWKYVTQLEVRILLNCVSSLQFTVHPPLLRFTQGLSDIETVMKEDKNVIEHWPDICQEIVHFFHAVHRWHKNDQPHDYSRHGVENLAAEGADGRVELTTYTESFFNVCKQMVLGLQERRGRLDLSGTGTVHLLQSIVSLFSDTRATSSVDSRRLWSELGIRIVELTVYITSQENRVRVLRSVSSLVAHKKVPPDAYFILVSYLPVNCVFSPVCRAYLTMLERTAENLTDQWLQEEDGDTSINSNQNVKIKDTKSGFGPYLRVLMCKNRSACELVISHLESVLCSLRSEMRLQLATEVILPYLKARLVEDDIDDAQNKNCNESTSSKDAKCQDKSNCSVLASVLDLLCTLVNEQPTAMVLIREQPVWAMVKKYGSRAGELSHVCQQIIKTLVLNSHKFKKIRLSEAEAMALQDDENDRINFDERDRKAQYWLFKQLYHVLVQSSNSVLTSAGTWPPTVDHMTSAWQITLDLVRKVPDFFLFALERGITDINTRLMDNLLNRCINQSFEKDDKDYASLLSALINFQVYALVISDQIHQDVLHTNINHIRENLTGKVFGMLRGILAQSNVNHCRIVLAGVLDSSFVTEYSRHDCESPEGPCSTEYEESGYEADESEDSDTHTTTNKTDSAYKVTFKESFHFFIDCLLDLCGRAGQVDKYDLLYTLEYLMYKVVHNCAVCPDNVTLFNEENGLTRLFAELHNLLELDFNLKNLCEMLISLVGQVARVQVLPSTIHQIFKLVSRNNQLQESVLVRVSSLLAELSKIKEKYTGVVVMPQENRMIALSASSSDSGLESTHSSAVASPVPICENPFPRAHKFSEDLGNDYAVVLRIKLAPAVKHDTWLTLLTIESNSQTVGLHINVKRGLKLTLANSSETIAAAETTFKSMLFPDQWIHLAFNLGTITEGKRETKTLTAYVNCHKVWGVGLSVDKPQTKVKKKETVVTVGPIDPVFDLENIVLNFILGPRDLNGLYKTKNICLDKIHAYLPDLLDACTKIISQPKLLIQHLDLAKNVVAHFSPRSFWRKVCQPSGLVTKDSWHMLAAIERVGGAECLLMLCLQALDNGYSNKTIIGTISNVISVLTSNQILLDDFVRVGGFQLISAILSAKADANLEILHMVLQASCVDVGGHTALFHPQLIRLSLQLLEKYPANKIQPGVILTSQFLAQLVSDQNPCVQFNLEMMKTHKLFDDILLCLQNINESEDTRLTEDDVSGILATFPLEAEFMMKLVKLVISTIPPNLLYLPHLARSLLHVTMVKENRNTDLINIVHKNDVVDASSALINPPDSVITRLSEESTLLANRTDDTIDAMDTSESRHSSEKDLDFECFETEEDKVGEWEVLTQPASPTVVQAHSHSSFFQSKECAIGCLVCVLLRKILSTFTVLSDTESKQLTETELKPEVFFPLVGHSSSEIHSPSLDIIGLILERSSKPLVAKFIENGGYYQLAALIQDAAPSPHLISSTLSLIHGHPIDVNIPFEFNKQSPPQLRLEASCLILPLILSSISYLSLGHNLLCHIHELLANIPAFASKLMSEHLLQTLMAGLVKLGDMPDKESDIFGCNESELLAEDINNILRMLIVFYADKKCPEYENILDVLFLTSGLINPPIPGKSDPPSFHTKLAPLSENSMISLRSGICLIIEETLLTLETGIARNIGREQNPIPLGPKYFQRDEFHDVDQDCSSPFGSTDHASPASSSSLMSRVNQMVRFYVNYLTSVTSRLLPEEETLGLSILRLCLDADQPQSLAKALAEAKSIGGAVLIHMFKYGTERRKIDLIKILESRFNILSILADMYPDEDSRETLRYCLLQTMKSCQIFGSADDAKRCTMFYGRVLCKAMFPEGPQANFEATFPVHHPSFGPWQAECGRCVSSFLKQVQKESRDKADTATKFTESIIQSHDSCRKDLLEQGRERISVHQKSLRSWKRIIRNQTHPLALWFDPEYQPNSLVLENITGLSGTYIRLKPAHSGLYKDRYYKDGFKYKCEPEKQRFSFLFGGERSEENLNSKLDYPEQIQVVESATEVTPTDVLESDILVTQDNLYVFSNISWSSRLTKIESMSKRRYQLKNIALELFLQSGETHMIVFKSQDVRESFAKLLQDNGICLNPKSDYLQTLTKRWRQGLITNFKYLCELNSLAGRTPNDLMQYPVFPWIISDYKSEHLDLTSEAAFRNLRKPIAIQIDENREKYETTYKMLKGDETSSLPGHMGPYHYSSHYSNTGIVLHLMVRLPPFTQEFIKFQDGNFDLADRSFHSLATSWDMVSRVSSSDVKELIPQLFYLPELFQNDEGFALGKRQNGKDVDNVELPPWAPDSRMFVKIHRQALESSHVKQEISHWIDLVFGFKQRGNAAIEAVNVFHPATYAHNLDKPQDDLERRARQTMIATYGQTPLQLFTSPHPLADIELNKERSSNTPVYRTVTGLKWGNYVGSPAYPSPYVVWHQVQPFQVRSLVRLESNQVVGLPANTLLVGNSSVAKQSDTSFLGPGPPSTTLLSWGFGDSALYYKTSRQGEETQLALLPMNDPVSVATCDNIAPTIWFGHKSGRISVYKINSKVSGHQGPAKFHLDFHTMLYGHMACVTGLVLSPEYSLALSASSNGYIMTWDLHSQSLLHNTCVHASSATTGSVADHGGVNTATNSKVLCAISESCGDIAVALDSTLTLYTVNLTKVCQTTIRGIITAITFSHLSEGISVNTIVIGTQGGGVRFFSSWDLTHIRDVAGCPPSPITELAFSLDCLSLIVASKNYFVTILEKSGSHGLNKTPKYLSVQ